MDSGPDIKKQLEDKFREEFKIYDSECFVLYV